MIRIGAVSYGVPEKRNQLAYQKTSRQLQHIPDLGDSQSKIQCTVMLLPTSIFMSVKEVIVIGRRFGDVVLSIGVSQISKTFRAFPEGKGSMITLARVQIWWWWIK